MKTKLLGRKLRNDRRGFSMVELLCAIGILATITTAIGGAMVISATTYKSGTEEVNLQKSAQFTANLIQDLIVDATNSVDFDAATKELKITNTDYTHTIVLVGGDLKYTKKDNFSAASESSVLAEDVSDFDVDVSDFARSRNAQVTLKMKDQSGAKELSTVYNITSRNNPKSSSAVSVTPLATISCETSVVLEPNQGYEIPVTVVATGGAVPGFDYNLIPEDDPLTTVTKDGDVLKISIGANEKGGADGKMTLTVSTKAINPVTGAPYDQKGVVIYIRRVLDFDMPKPVLVSGTALRENAIYEVKATPTGSNLDQNIGKGYEQAYLYNGVLPVSDYISPLTAYWEFSAVTSNPGETWNDYVEIQHTEETTAPLVRFRLKKDIAVGESVTITAHSKHSQGTVAGARYNRTGIFYEDVQKSQTIKAGNYYMSSDFLRGDDFIGLVELINWEDIKNKYGGTQPFRVIRCCPAILDANGDVVALTGTWSPWYDMTDGGTGGAFVRPNDMELNPAMSYAVEVKAQYGYSKDHITWPKADTPEEEYLFCFGVPAVTVTFDYYYDWQISGGNPIYFPVGTDGWDINSRLKLRKDELYRFYVKSSAAHMAKLLMANNKLLTYNLQRKDGDGWVNVNAQEFGWEYVNADTGSLKIKMPATVGIYRFELMWDKTEFEKKWTPCMDYADATTGKGIFYFEVVGN